MRIIVFDTETTDLNKCFTYNVGYLIYDTDTAEVLEKQDFVIEQVWYNLPLFETAYYADKRPLYVSAMKGKRAKMIKFGYAMRKLSKAIADYEVECGYAYNSPFDEKVFKFNCDWFKVANPLDAIPIYDIRGLVHQYVAFTEDFQEFCDTHGLYTETGNYSTTAETVYKYITGNTDFIEAHTALADSVIEAEILNKIVANSEAEYNKGYKVYNSVPKGNKKIAVMERTGEVLLVENYRKIRVVKDSSGTQVILD